MLTQTLRSLERNGMVTRTVIDTAPPIVTYSLTELGRSLQVAITAFRRWTQEHHACVIRAQREFDARH